MLDVNLIRLIPPDDRGFHLSTCKFNDEQYICIYHNSENHRLASCFLDKNFKIINNSHTEDLCITKNIDPRLVKYGDKFYLSTSQLNFLPEFIELYELSVTDKIKVLHESKISFISGINGLPESNHTKSEKNWSPWVWEDKFMYTYTLNPHTIVEVDINNKKAQLLTSTRWKSNTWWENQSWEIPTFRLNCPPVKLNDGTFLSVFHTMKFMNLDTPWHKIKPNYLRSYWTGFFQFEATFPFRVIKISKMPFISPDFLLPESIPFHPPPSGGNPFYPFSILLEDDKIILTGGCNEIALVYCTINLSDILHSLEEVTTD